MPPASGKVLLLLSGGFRSGVSVKSNSLGRASTTAGVNVTVAFDTGFQLPEKSSAKTNEPGLGEGRPPIVIIPGPSDAGHYASGATISGEISSAVEPLFPKAVVTNFDKTTTRISDAATALNACLERFNTACSGRSKWPPWTNPVGQTAT